MAPLPSDHENEDHTPSTTTETARRGSGAGPEYPILEVDRMLNILTLANESPQGVSATELPRLFQMSERSINKLLRALEQCRCLERDPITGRLHIGTAMTLLRVPRIEILARHARAVLERLCDQLGETTNLAVLDGRCLDVRSFPAHRLARFVLSGVDQRRFFSTACGKAVLSRLQDERIRDLLHLPEDSTPGDLTALEEIRRRGYAIDDRETVPDGRCVAVPALGMPIPAAISVSAPAARLPLSRIPHIADLLHEAARTLVHHDDRAAHEIADLRRRRGRPHRVRAGSTATPW